MVKKLGLIAVVACSFITTHPGLTQDKHSGKMMQAAAAHISCMTFAQSAELKDQAIKHFQKFKKIAYEAIELAKSSEEQTRLFIREGPIINRWIIWDPVDFGLGQYYEKISTEAYDKHIAEHYLNGGDVKWYASNQYRQENCEFLL